MLPPLPTSLPPEKLLQVELARRSIGGLSREKLEEITVQLLEQMLFHQMIVVELMKTLGQ
jgi:hypothetical protein